MGCGLLLADAVLAGIIIKFVELGANQSKWEDVFAIVAVGVVPMYAMYLFVSDIVDRVWPGT